MRLLIAGMEQRWLERTVERCASARRIYGQNLRSALIVLMTLDEFQVATGSMCTGTYL